MQSTTTTITRRCAQCGTPIDHMKATATACGATCRKRLSRLCSSPRTSPACSQRQTSTASYRRWLRKQQTKRSAP